MAKAKSGAKNKPTSEVKKAPKAKPGVLKAATKSVSKAAARLVKAAPKGAGKGKPAASAAAEPRRGAKVSKKTPAESGASESSAAAALKARPRATKLPPPGQPLTTREMEQLLTVGAGRGVAGEGSLKGRLNLKDGLPVLQVVGRDKRELTFLLQGPDQEVLPAYVAHKVSVSGLIKKTHNYGGSVDVRRYSAKKPELAAVAPQETKLRYLSPGDVEQVCNAGMGAGMRGFASMRGNLEMTGEEFFLVVSNGGTRHQVSFILQGKGAKGLRKSVGQAVVVTGVVDKTSGWGGTVQVENVEPRLTEFKGVSRDGLEIVSVQVSGAHASAAVRLNHGLSVRLAERAGYTWAIEPTSAKRVGLREANFEPASSGPGAREFFFTPRNPGAFDVDFFLAKAFTPAQVSKTFRLQLTVSA